MKSVLVAVVSTAAVLVLPGCADNRPLFGSAPAYSSPGYASTTTTPSYIAYGVVKAVRPVDEQVSTGTTGGGALLGGLAGGVLGHQMGQGRGNTAATIAGATAGALIGNEIERGQRSQVATRRVYQIDVRMDDGSYQTFTQDDRSFRIGERVVVRDGTLMHRY